jgi:hypothetical protein
LQQRINPSGIPAALLWLLLVLQQYAQLHPGRKEVVFEI